MSDQFYLQFASLGLNLLTKKQVSPQSACLHLLYTAR